MKKKIFFLLTTILVLIVIPHFVFAQIPPRYRLIKVCALRVEFQPDNNPLTTGNGLMMDSVTTDPYAIDPAPHNKQYFEDQLTAAANYFWRISRGKIKIEGEVFPRGENDVFRLNKKMADYNPNTTDQEINKGIARLFIDAIRVADSSDQAIDFSKYDLIIVFHAGVGKDIQLGYDPTPQDISSLFLNEQFFKKALGPEFDGILVDQGKTKIYEGILLPETQNQEGYQIALTGFLVSNIGSYLGLFDLFSPGTQKSAIGRFGLMDAGLLNANGLIPAPPCAFSRSLLGWEKPEEITQPVKNVPVARLFSEQAFKKPTIYKIPINEDEYYLIECRGDPNVNIDSLYNELSYNRNELPSYLELLKTKFADKIKIGASGVVTDVENYDWGLPGAGILIWHIDERVIREKGLQNRINDDPERRAVDLEEADGSQDIGQAYGLLDAGYGTELGWFADFWFKNRPAYLKDFELYTNEFSSTSHPATLSNRNRAFTHIKLYDFSDNLGDVMYFSYTLEMTESGFPLKLKHASKITTWISYRYPDDTTYFYLGDQNGQVFSVKRGSQNGLPVVQTVWKNSTSAVHRLSVISGSGFFKLAIAYQTKVIIVPHNHIFGQTSPSSVMEWQAPAPIVAGPISYEDKMYLACANDSLYTFQLTQGKLQLLSRKVGYGRFRDLAIAPSAEIPADLLKQDSVLMLGLSEDISPNGRFFALTKQDSQAVVTILPSDLAQPFTLPENPVGNFALANLTEGDIPELVFNGKRKIYAYNFNGTLVTQFPLTPVLDAGDVLVGSPLIADINGDGKAEMVTVTENGVLLALNLNNQLLDNFPLSSGAHVSLSPILLQWDDDNAAEVAVVSDSGRIYLWKLAGSSVEDIYWGQANLNGTNNKIFRVSSSGKPMLSKDQNILPANKVYNYPNPNQGNFTTIRFYLSEEAEVTIRIFDLSGKLIRKTRKVGVPNTDNEWQWNVEKVASGIYLCQVEAKSKKSGQSERRLFKIMVVH